MCRRAVVCTCLHCLFFFFNDTAPTEIYTLSLHDALPIFGAGGFLDEGGNRFDRHPRGDLAGDVTAHSVGDDEEANLWIDRKSTRLNSSHSQISYAVFCLKKKKNTNSTRATSSAPMTPFST